MRHIARTSSSLPVVRTCCRPSRNRKARRSRLNPLITVVRELDVQIPQTRSIRSSNSAVRSIAILSESIQPLVRSHSLRVGAISSVQANTSLLPQRHPRLQRLPRQHGQAHSSL